MFSTNILYWGGGCRWSKDLHFKIPNPVDVSRSVEVWSKTKQQFVMSHSQTGTYHRFSWRVAAVSSRTWISFNTSVKNPCDKKLRRHNRRMTLIWKSAIYNAFKFLLKSVTRSSQSWCSPSYNIAKNLIKFSSEFMSTSMSHRES